MAKEDVNIRIKQTLDNVEAAKSLSDYKKALRDLQGLALETSDTNREAFNKITSAVGETTDKINDMKAVIKSQSGEPIENLRASFGGLKGSLMSLDFKSFRQQFDVFTGSVGKLGGQLLGGVNVVKTFKTSVAAGDGPLKALTKSMYGLGTSIAATGIGALVIILGLVITNFGKLTEAGGLVGKMFNVIGDAIGFVIDYLTELMDKFKLTDIKGAERHKTALKNAQDEREAISRRYDAEIAKAEAAGKSVDDLNKKKNAALAYSINQELKLLEAEKKRKGKLTDEELEQQKSLYQQRQALVDANEIIDIKKNKASQDAKDELNKKAADKKKERDDKAKAEEEKYQKDLEAMKDKYFLSEREKLAKSFDDNLKRLRDKTEEEKKLRAEIEKDKEKALAEFDAKQAKAEEDKKNADIEKQKQKDLEIFNEKKAQLEDEMLLYEDDLVKKRDFVAAHYKELGMTENEYKVFKAKIDEEITDKEKEENKKREDDAKKIRDAKFQLAQDLVSGLSNLNEIVSIMEMNGLKEGTKEYEAAARKKFNTDKALKLASATITGIQSVMEAYKNGTSTPIPGAGIAMGVAYASIAAIAAAANIAKIAATQYKSAGSIGSPAGGGAPPELKAPTAAPMTAAQQLGLGNVNIAQPSEKSWQKVYVTEGDIRQTTNKVQVIENRSVLGA